MAEFTHSIDLWLENRILGKEVLSCNHHSLISLLSNRTDKLIINIIQLSIILQSEIIMLKWKFLLEQVDSVIYF